MNQSAYDAAIRRVHKLLRLARSANEHEAAQAAAQAARLMEQYHIEQAELALAEEAEATPRMAEPIEPGLPAHGVKHDSFRREPAWQTYLVWAVQAQFACRSFHRGGQPHLFGRRSSVQAASYVFQFLVREIDRLAREAGAQQGRPGRSWYHAFRLGAASAVQGRLEAEAHRARAERRAKIAAARGVARGEPLAGEAPASEAPTNSHALMRLGKALERVEEDEREVEREYKAFAASFSKGRSLRTRYSAAGGGFQMGRDAGARIQITGARAGLGTGQRRLPT